MSHRGMENFAFEISDTARLIRREANRRVAFLGATRAQWRVLKWLAHTGGNLRQIELADALDVEPISLCRMIDRLEEAGLVERRRDETDRRAVIFASRRPIDSLAASVLGSTKADQVEWTSKSGANMRAEPSR